MKASEEYDMRKILMALGVTSVVVAGFTTVASAQRYINDGARSSNTYQTYLPGQSGCVEDLGYGRVKDGCSGE
jgi:hypothetical protein